jgi:transposase
MPVHVLTKDEAGNRLIEWQSDSGKNLHAFVRADGRLIASMHGGASMSQTVFVENIPEEPEDTILLYKLKTGDRWIADFDGKPHTRSYCEKHSKRWSSGYEFKFVTVGA